MLVLSKDSLTSMVFEMNRTEQKKTTTCLYELSEEKDTNTSMVSCVARELVMKLYVCLFNSQVGPPYLNFTNMAACKL